MEFSLFLAVKIQIINDEIGKSKFCQGLSNFLKGNFLLSKRHCGRASRTMAHNTPMSMYMSPSIPRQNRYVPCGGGYEVSHGVVELPGPTKYMYASPCMALSMPLPTD